MDKFIDWHPADIVEFFNAGERPDPPLAERRINHRHGAGYTAMGHLAVTLP